MGWPQPPQFFVILIRSAVAIGGFLSALGYLERSILCHHVQDVTLDGMATKREIRITVLDPAGRPFTDVGPNGFPEAYNADTKIPLMLKVEVSCELGWHELQVLPLKNWG